MPMSLLKIGLNRFSDLGAFENVTPVVPVFSEPSDFVFYVFWISHTYYGVVYYISSPEG